jgi:rhodanese-related sulfurtransferase
MQHFIEFATRHTILVSLFFGLLAALFFVDRRRSGMAMSPQQVTLLMNKDEAVVVDLRDKKEFSEGHIKGSKHIPFSSLKERISELSKEDGKIIVFVDKSGQHSGMAGKMLQAEGYQHLGRMTGGIAEWKHSNLPLVKK